ncbi:MULTISPECIES: shikimate dehydrogenase [unclassified Pseudomonas]|uniref:shikimate dehydrogenase n=1 Tax=unclassified Pseudomonas TaxID=196821 RepID=UPI001DFA7088|nr:shikimate dehydrogenase [Pseudomonas sp. Bi70]CAH0292381.1 Shikimate dehydrogenase (NADP(+)) [Pseudomonas sp. Bi70]
MTDQYAVIGNPIGHTKSPLIHGLFAESCGQRIEYTAIEGSTSDFAGDVARFQAQGGRGMNITAPFKLQAFELATQPSERARLARAANAFKFEGDAVLAENFDGVGLLRDIEHNLGHPLAGRRVLLLGAGGAVRGALLPFLAAGPAHLVLANRDMAKARVLENEVNDPRLLLSTYEDLAGQSFDLVINATSASLTGELPPVPEAVFANAALAYELAYGKGLTPFLQLAKKAGVNTLADGVGMLVEQAAEAFAWWRGVRPQTGPVIQRLTVPLV